MIIAKTIISLGVFSIIGTGTYVAYDWWSKRNADTKTIDSSDNDNDEKTGISEPLPTKDDRSK